MSRVPRAIRTRILAAFLVCIGMFTGALGYSLFEMSRIGDGIHVLAEVYHPISRMTVQLSQRTRGIARAHERLGENDIGPQQGNLARAERFDESLRGTVADGLELLEEATRRARNEQTIEGIESLHFDLLKVDSASRRYLEKFEAWVRSEPENRDATFEELEHQREQLSRHIGNLSENLDAQIGLLDDRTSNAQSHAFSIAGALALSAILLGALLSGVALYTMRPIGILTQQVQRLAGGDYSGRVDVTGFDEMGVLGQEINAMAEAVEERGRILVERADALDRLSLRLRRILDTIQAGLVVVRQGKVETVNPAATRLWNLSEGGRLPPELSTLDVGTHRATTIDARVFDVVLVPFGEEGHLLVGEDVTQQMEDQSRLARSERLALVGRMLAQITHEVRNPLNAMSLNAELLAEDLADSPHQELIDTILQEVRRLEQVTNHYLELSRGRRVELNPVDPLDLIRDLVKVEAQALQIAGVSPNILGESPGVIETDTDALRRAILNLLRNTAEAGASRIDLHLSVHEDDLLIDIEDDGPGIDSDHLGRIFEPFYTTKTTGTGLGLAISRQELEDVGGSLTVIRSDEHGCRFRIQIPIRRT